MQKKKRFPQGMKNSLCALSACGSSFNHFHIHKSIDQKSCFSETVCSVHSVQSHTLVGRDSWYSHWTYVHIKDYLVCYEFLHYRSTQLPLLGKHTFSCATLPRPQLCIYLLANEFTRLTYIWSTSTFW